MATYTNLNKKLFGTCTVEWRIDNTALQMSTNEWLIQSPEFNINGSENTSWCMSLHPELVSNNYFLLFNLRRCATDAGPKYVRLKLKLNFIYSNEQSTYCNDKLLFLKNGSKYEVLLGSMEYLSKIDQFDDSFIIICDMIVYSKYLSRRFEECHDAGLKLLSENMLGLFRSSKNFDTKLILNDNVILAHRPILCARNAFLSSIIGDDDDIDNEEFQEYTIINLNAGLDYEGMRKTLAYLYTGDMRHVFEEPSFAIHECVSFLGISEIETHYKPDVLILKSTVDFQEYSFTLWGYAFENSRWMWNVDADAFLKTYRLLFYPQKKDCKDYILLFTKTSQQPLIAFLEFYVFDVNNGLCDALKFTLKDESVSIDETIGEIAKELLSNHDVYEIVMELKVSTGTKISNVVGQNTVFVSHVNKNTYYEFLSADMELLLDGGPFTDTLIDCGGTYFGVHKCVLASRSSFFANTFITNEEGEVVISSNLDRRAIYAMLIYIYTGVLSDIFDDNVITVYKAAIWANLPQLKSICSDWLKVSCLFNRSLRCRVVRIAEEYEDATLKKSVISQLFDKKDTAIIPNEQHFFEDVYTCRNCS